MQIMFARLLVREVLSHQAEALPALLVTLVAFVLQSFIVPLRSAKLLDETTGASCAGDEQSRRRRLEEFPSLSPWVASVCVASSWWSPALARICLIQLVALGARSLERLLTEQRSVRVRVALQQRCFAAILRQDDAFLDKRRVGELLGTIRDPGVAFLCNDVAPAAIRAIVALVGGAIAMVYADGALAAVAVSTAPILFAVQKARSKVARRAARKGHDAQAAAQVVATEALHQRPTMRAHAAEGAGVGIECVAHDRALQEVVRHADGALHFDVLMEVVAETLVSAGEIALLAVAAHRRSVGALSIGTYAAFRAGLLQYQRGLREVTKTVNRVTSSLVKAEKYMELISHEPTILITDQTLALSRAPPPVAPSPGPPRVEFKNVTFGYDDQVARVALDGVSLVLAPRTTTALVGTSGSGKSTMGALLLRLFDPQAGSILIDGVPLPSLDVVRHRKRIGVVQQEPCLFDRTVADNIAYGVDPPPTRDRIVRAAESANLVDVIAHLPEGYDERLGEHSRLSGGEKQRLAIARALGKEGKKEGTKKKSHQVRDPTLLLLDEATSALDAASETVVLRALLDAAVGRTTLTIAHRLVTIRTADAIAVMDKGRIVERGSHEDLVRLPNGLYAGLVARQLGSPPAPKLPRRQPNLSVNVTTPGDSEDSDSDATVASPIRI